MIVCGAICGGFLLDLLFGEPEWILHPVVIMGRVIGRLEVWLRRLFAETTAGALAGGTCLAVILPAGTLLFTAAVCWIAAWVHPVLGLAVQMIWCWQALAVRGLRAESTNVYTYLRRKDLPGARKAVARIVVTKATVETVAENFSDGVMAPLLFMAIGGAPLAMTYKSINTMDSMIGYKNERYLYFGRAAAKLDDAANYIPARLAAVFWIAAAGVTGNSARGAWKMWQRDSRNHSSPNSAQTESACAGALGVQLAGPAYYFGERYDKPTIGDATRPIEPEDILRSNRMLYAASSLAFLSLLLLRLAVFMWILGGIG